MDFKLEMIEGDFQRADELIKDKDLEGAKEILFRIIEEEPTFGKAYNHIGWLYETQEKRFREAEAYYKKAIEISPEYPAPYINYLYLLNTELRGNEAESLIEKAKEVVGINKVSLWTEWAYMLEYTGRLEQAIEKYREIIPMQNNIEKLDQLKTDIERCRKKLELLKF